MNRNWSRILLFAVATTAIVVALGCQKKAASGPSDTRDVLGTKVTITVYDPGLTAQDLKPVFDEMFALMASWEKRTLSPGGDNQVRHISSGAGEQSITTDQDVFQMLMKAIRLYDSSGKAFDIRYGPMLDAWGFGGRPHVPSPQQLDTLKAYVGDGGMFVAGNGILLAKPGMRFDVQEVIQGYVFDQVAARLSGKGILTAMIHSAYVWRMIGDPPDRRGFPVTLGNPVTSDSGWAIGYAPTGGLAYAAASRNHFEANGKMYHSLLDPRTGMPANRLVGALVQAADAATAQALAYGVFVHGTPDSLTQDGRSSVTGSVLISGTKESPQIKAAGSLAGRIRIGK